MQEQSFEKVLVTLSTSQEMIEKSSFDSINQHDKVTNLISTLMAGLNHMTMNLEMISEQLEDIQLQKDTPILTDTKFLALSKMLEEQNTLQAEANQCLQVIIEEHSLESEVIHDMELQIADQREIINEACYIEK